MLLNYSHMSNLANEFFFDPQAFSTLVLYVRKLPSPFGHRSVGDLPLRISALNPRV